MELYSRVALLLAVLWLLAILACAVVSGVLLLAFVAGTALLCRWYWLNVVSKPRVQAVEACRSIGVYFGETYMEVVA